MKNSLLDLAGIGPATVRHLTEAGFGDLESIAQAEPETLIQIPGIGPARAASVHTAAQQLLPSSDANAAKGNGQLKRRKRAKKLSKQGKQLGKQAKQLTKKARSTKSKKKRKKRLRQAADLEAAAKKARRKARKLLAG